MVRALSLLALILLAGCQVSRVPEESGTGPAELPRLRRATTALKEAIQLEKQHVAHFNEELRAIRERERSLAFEVEEAEADYQRLLGDLGGVESDLAGVEGELAGARQTLGGLQDELTGARAAIGSAEAELEVLEATARRHQETRVELDARVAAAAAEEQAALERAARAETQLAAVRDGLAVTLEALQARRGARALLSRELLTSLLMSHLRGDGAPLPEASTGDRSLAGGAGPGAVSEAVPPADPAADPAPVGEAPGEAGEAAGDQAPAPPPGQAPAG